MKRLLLALLISVAAQAATPVISRVVVDYVDYGTARINVRTDPAIVDPLIYIMWGYSNGAVTIESYHNLCNTTNSGAFTDCAIMLQGVRADVNIFFKVRIFDGATEDTTWGCSGGSITEGTLTGATCGASDSWPHFRTDPLPGGGNPTVSYPNGTYPVQPVLPTLRLPTVTNPSNIFTVASDCSDMNTMIASAAAINDDTLVKLPVQTSATCGAITLPNKTNAHTMIIRTAATDDQIAPPGHRILPAHQPFMAKVSSQLAPLTLAASKNGYTFVGIDFTVDSEYPTAAIPTLTIASTTSQFPAPDNYIWVITVSGGTLPTNLASGSPVFLDGVANLNSECSPGLKPVNSVLNSTQFTIYCAALVIPPGTDSAPGQSMVTAGSQRISSITLGACAGGNARLTLDVGSAWGLSDDNVITIANAVGITGINNRGWRVATASGRNICLQGSSGLSGTYTANSGIYAIDTSTRSIISSSGGETDIWFDRCWIDSPGFPNKIAYAFNLTGSTNSGFINGRITDVGGWASIDPNTGIYVTYISGLGILTGIAAEITGTTNTVIDNNYITGTGILLFAQQQNIATGFAATSNTTVTRNDVTILPERMAGGPEWTNGLYWPHRHFLECKTCSILKIEGNTINGNWSDDVVAGTTYAFTPRQLAPENAHDPTTATGGVRDLTIRNNSHSNIAGGVNIGQFSDSNRYDVYPTVRIAVENNLWHPDYWNNRSEPSGQSGAVANNSLTGATMVYISMMHSLNYDHNTIFDPRGYGPRMFSLGGLPVGFWRWTNNIWVENKPVDPPMDYGGMAGLFPGTFVGMWPIIASYWDATATNVADPYSMYEGNVIVPGSENNFETDHTDLTCYASTAGDCNITQTERDNYFGTTSIPTLKYASVAFSGTSPNARIDQMVWQNYPQNNFRLRYDSPGIAGARKSGDGLDNGVLMDPMFSAQGKMPNGPRYVSGSSDLVRYIAPDSGACFVKPSNDITTGTWTSDGGGARVRNTTVTLGGASTVWVTCGSETYQCPTNTSICTLVSN